MAFHDRVCTPSPGKTLDSYYYIAIYWQLVILDSFYLLFVV